MIKPIQRGDILQHQTGALGEAAADEVGGKVLVATRSGLRTWGRYEIVDPAPVDRSADTELE